MDKPFWETDYEIEAACDKDGDFPIQCACLLFDLLNINENIIIKNRYAAKREKAEVLKKYIDNKEKHFFEWHKHPEANYCLWVREHFYNNKALIDILKLQGIYLSYIVPSDSFNWENFTEKWEENEQNLLLSGQALFICNVLDMDRTLNICFNSAAFPKEKIMSVLSQWEKMIVSLAESTQVKRTTAQLRTKYGNKPFVRLCLE